MGIKGIGQLIKKHCPEVVKPVELASFKGQRVAIDGNLLTLRFHFGSPDYSLPGLWYRFLSSLQYQDIQPVVLFDGDTRLPQKQRTLLKRKEQRLLLHSRSIHETNQVERYASIIQHLDHAAATLSPKSLSDFHHHVLASWRDAIPKEVAQSAEKTQPAFETPTSPLSSQANEVLEQILPLLPLATLAHPFKLSKSQILLRNDERDTIEANIASKSTTGTDDETPDPITALSSLRAGVADLHAQSAELAHGYQQRSRTVSKETHEEVESLIRAMGVPLLKTSSESVHEAEALGAVLYHTGDVAAVFTEDTDVLLYDAPIVRDFVGRTKTPTIIHGRELREAFGLDVSAFIDLGLLCGSDFMETIPKVGPVTAFKLIKEHGSIEQILQADADRPKPRCILPDIASYLESLSLAREVFHSPPLLPTEPGVMNSQPVDREALAAILQKYGIDTLPKIPNENFDNLEIPSRISTPASESESEDWPPVRDSRF